MRQARVTYIDAARWDELHTIDDLDDELCVFHATGFIVKETDRVLYLAREAYGVDLRGTLGIPKCTITYRLDLPPLDPPI